MVNRLLTSRYELLEQLGQGGMGRVFRAKDRLTGDMVALKQVLVAPGDLDFASLAASRSDMRLALTREFRTLAGLRHPNIISVLDYGYDRYKQPFYTMEYIAQPRTILQAGQYSSLHEKVGLLLGLLQGLAYPHRRHIIHRDLKPANIFVVGDQVKLLDFGLALTRQDSDPSSGAEGQDLVGTLAYIAPEQFGGAARS